MLHAISWAGFFKTLLCATALYYFVIGVLFYRIEIVALIRGKRRMMAMVPLALLGKAALAQTADATNGINQANTMVRGYFDVAANLMYAVGAILALIGAVRVFQHWNDHHRQDVLAAASAWFGSCIFLVVVATVIKSFFGL